jgi:hypothetical protein
MFFNMISTQASPIVKFTTCKLEIESEAKHGTQTHPLMGIDRRVVPIAIEKP